MATYRNTPLPHRPRVTRDELVDARYAAGLRQAELAERWGISRAHLSAFENGTPPAWVADALVGLRDADEKTKIRKKS